MGGGYSDAHAILAEETAMPVRFNTASAGACAASCRPVHRPACAPEKTWASLVVLGILCGSRP